MRLLALLLLCALALPAGRGIAASAVTTVPTLSALKALPASDNPVVFRAGYVASGDGGEALYVFSPKPCGLDGGAGDNGSEVKAANAGCWNALFGPSVSVRAFGAVGDGSTDDSPAFQAAITYEGSRHGGVVTVPPSGAAYYLREGIAVGGASNMSGVTLRGTAGMYWPGPYDNTEAHWTAFGSVIKCGDLTRSCMTLNGNGGAIEGLTFWYTQPTPPAGVKGDIACGATCVMAHGWRPTDYPYTITVAPPQNFNHLSDITVVNGTKCIDVQGGKTGVATIYTYIEHVRLGCFETAVRLEQVDNTVSVNDYRDQLWWYPFNAHVIGYTEGDAAHAGHKIGLDLYYAANTQLTNVEFYQDWAAIRATDAVVKSGLGTVVFGAQALQFSNVSFNQTCQAVTLASASTHFSAHFNNTILATDPQTSFSGQCGAAYPYAFNLASNNVDVTISNLDGYDMQSIAQVGAGTGGVLHVNGNIRGTYSAFAPGGNAFKVNAGASLDVPSGVQGLVAGKGAGAVLNGVARSSIIELNQIAAPAMELSSAGTAHGAQVQGSYPADALRDASTAPAAKAVCFNEGRNCVSYNGASGKFVLTNSAGTPIASIDARGNAVFRGSVTPNGTP